MREIANKGEHLLIKPDSLEEGFFCVTGEDFFHLFRVKRARKGEEFTWSDGAGRYGRAKLAEIGSDKATFRILEMRENKRGAPILRLYQALPKAGKMEDIIRRCTEVGVDIFAPFATSRSIPTLKDYWSDRRRLRWEKVIKEAARQSRRIFLPVMEKPLGWRDLLIRLKEEEFVLLGWEGERNRRILDSLPEVAPRCIAMVIGPEGGFSETEVRELSDAGAITVTLGCNILRVENAGLVMSTLVSGYYGLI